MKRLFMFWLFLASARFASAQPAAQFDPGDEIHRGNLKGLKAVGLIVAQLDRDLERSGLIQDEIEADAEARLKQSGIKILSGKERMQTPGRPYLYIAATSACQKSTNSCSVDVHVALIESIPQETDPTIVTNTAIWRRDHLSVLEKKKLNTILGQIAEFVEQFRAALQAANR
jgi:hypothetical protein